MASAPTPLTFMVVLLSFFIATCFAGFSSSNTNNIAIYWGQNSYGTATGAPDAQQRLSYYCSNTNIDIIPLAFLKTISTPYVDFANAGDNCTVFSGSTLLDCPQLEEDIQTCQSTYGKTIMLSIGGATYTEGGFSSASAASAAADNIWAMFGPVQSGSSVNRPFGKAVIDGFDFDFEAATSNMAPFASELRSKMDAASAEGGKSYYLSAAPQCPYPDTADNDMIAGVVSFDFIMVQFYNNYCGLQSFTADSVIQTSFDFSTWDNWAKTTSKNPDVRILLGIPGSSTAAGSGYISGSSLASVIAYSKTFSSFGGVMAWDMSQIFANSGFLDSIGDSLQSGILSPSTTTSASATSTDSKTTSIPIASSSVTKMPVSYGHTLEETPTTTSSSYDSALPPPVVSTFTTKMTSPRQAYIGSSPTTLSTVTRSAVNDGRQIDKGTGSCATPSAATVTSYVTVSRTANQAASSLSTVTTINAGLTQSTIVKGENTVKQWGQCGGVGYSGSTQCESPYTCVSNSKWWAQCQ